MFMAKETTFESIRMLATGGENRVEKARKIAEAIRNFGPYRWVGVYDVGESEVSIIAYSGSSAPAHPSFPVGKGLTGSAIKEKSTVVVGDVTKDPCRAWDTMCGRPRSPMRTPRIGSCLSAARSE
jgi:putative methionine-R-sulfoxide reductase with GAF domain